MSTERSAPVGRPDSSAVVVEGLHKSFPRRRTLRELLSSPLSRPSRVEALRGIELVVARGELVGLLGPNGAGKTTLLKVLSGLVLPERGRAAILGVPVERSALSRVLGLVHGDERSFYWRLTARENLQFFARLYGMRGAERTRRVQQLLERVELADDADRRFGDFSSGMRQRLAIARALLADPEVLLMDEPTRSLDPVSAARLRGWIRDDLHQAAKKTILVATHNLREAETLCDRIVIVARGEVRAAATPEALRREGLAGPMYRFRLRGPAPGPLDGIRVVSETATAADECRLRVQLHSEEDLDGWLAHLRAHGSKVLSCDLEEPDLEQIFERLVALRDEPAGESRS